MTKQTLSPTARPTVAHRIRPAFALLAVLAVTALVLPPHGWSVLGTLATWSLGVAAVTAVPFLVVWLVGHLVDAADSLAA